MKMIKIQADHGADYFVNSDRIDYIEPHTDKLPPNNGKVVSILHLVQEDRSVQGVSLRVDCSPEKLADYINGQLFNPLTGQRD